MTVLSRRRNILDYANIVFGFSFCFSWKCKIDFLDLYCFPKGFEKLSFSEQKLSLQTILPCKTTLSSFSSPFLHIKWISNVYGSGLWKGKQFVVSVRVHKDFVSCNREICNLCLVCWVHITSFFNRFSFLTVACEPVEEGNTHDCVMHRIRI